MNGEVLRRVALGLIYLVKAGHLTATEFIGLAYLTIVIHGLVGPGLGHTPDNCYRCEKV